MTVNICSDLHWHNTEIDFTYPPCIKKINDKCERIDFKKFDRKYPFICAGDLANTFLDNNIITDMLRSIFIYGFIHVNGNHDSWEDILSPTAHIQNQASLDYDYVFLKVMNLHTPHTSENIFRENLDYKYIHNLKECQLDLFNSVKDNLKWKINTIRSTNPRTKIVVITHICPRIELIVDRYKDLELTKCFSICDHSFDDIRPDVWIYGHDHTTGIVDETIDGVRYIKNCLRDMDMNIRKDNYNYITEI